MKLEERLKQFKRVGTESGLGIYINKNGILYFDASKKQNGSRLRQVYPQEIIDKYNKYKNGNKR